MSFTIKKSFADNPVVQTCFTADPAPMVYNNTVYLYTSHDEDDAPDDGFKMLNWKCYTSTDMSNWTDHGTIASLATFSWAATYNAWAPQCIFRNGKFYLYCPVAQKNGVMAIGVAVSDSPTGPFTDAIGKPLIGRSGEDIDPTVFIDDDGQAYLYWGNPNLNYVKLNQDMVSYSGSIVKESSKPSNYQEGPWFYKRNGLYYLAYASTCCPEGIGYCMSNSPTGPWTYKGLIVNPQPNSAGNHPGIIDYKGNSYVFGFNAALPGGGNQRRSVCVEKFNYNSDGTIQNVSFTTSGAPQIGTLNPYVKNEAETICWETGVKTETCNEGGVDVCNIENGDSIKVKGVDFGTGSTSFETRVASASNGGNIEIRLDSATGKLVGTCAISNTSGWQTWLTKSCTISGASGVHDLYFRFTGGSGNLFNFNWWKFYEAGTTIPTPTQVTATPTEIPNETPASTTFLSNSPITTPTTTPESSYVRLRNVATGLYIDGMGSTSNGSNACQWSDSNSNNQQWTIANSGEYVMIKNRVTGLYLDGMGNTSNGSVCGQWSNSGSTNQQWIQDKTGSNVRFKNCATGLYLDGMGSTSNGSNLCQWSNSGSNNQQWQIE